MHPTIDVKNVFCFLRLRKNMFLMFFIDVCFFILKKHAKLKGIECDSDSDSDCEWNILAIFVGFLHMNNSVNTL